MGLLQPALDPRAQLVHSGRGGAFGGASGEHHLHAGVGVDVHAHPPGAVRAPDRVGNLAHATQGTPLTGGLAPGHNPRVMGKSRVRLPREMRGGYEVFLNGVPQRLGVDYTVRDGSLVFERELRKDTISGWRWLLGAWGVGTYRQNDSVDVRYEAADGSPRVAEGLEIELG